MAKVAPPKRKPTPVTKMVDFEPDLDLEEVSPHNGKPTGAKNRQATAIKETEILDAVAGLNLDAVSGTLATTQVEVQKALADLSAKLVERLQLLRNVEEAIVLKRDELKQLYDLETAEVELDDLQAQIEAQRHAWDEEQARRQREFAEQRAEREKQWARAEEEYQYRLEQEHKKQSDTFETEMEEQAKANRNNQEALEKNWAEREAELKKREKELEDLRAQAANFSEVVKKEVNAAAAIATNSVKKEYEMKLVLATKDADTAQKLAQMEVGSLKQALEKATAQMADVKAQLDQAHRDAKEISAKALESASGRSAMEALQKVLEKEPNYKPSK